MPFLKLTKANDGGQLVGPVVLNSDCIVTMEVMEDKTTEIRTLDDRELWILESPETILGMLVEAAEEWQELK